MSRLGISLWAITALAVGVGCTRYEAPCTVGNPEEIVAFSTAHPGSMRLSRIAEDGILVLGTQTASSASVDLEVVVEGLVDGGVHDAAVSDGGVADGAVTSTDSIAVEAVSLTREGVVLAQHRFIAQLPYGNPVWIGDGLATISTPVDVNRDNQGVSHVAQQLLFSIYDEHGLRAGPMPIPRAACTDCELRSAIRAVGDEAMVLWSVQADREAAWQSSWMVFGRDGTVRATGSLGELAPDESVDMSRFAAPQRAGALLVPTTRDRVWLADNRFRPLTQPFTSQPTEQWDWDSARTRISRSWFVASGDILTDRIGFDGHSQLVEDRISVGSNVLAVADAPESIGVVLRSYAEFRFAARGSDGVKLGGDVIFNFEAPSVVLIATGASTFQFYSVEDSAANVTVLQRRTIECHR